MSYSQNMRDEFARKRATPNNKLRRIFAKPEQVEREGDNIVINPPNEDALARAEREAKEARKLADEARART